jgi:hypothetical protein
MQPTLDFDFWNIACYNFATFTVDVKFHIVKYPAESVAVLAFHLWASEFVSVLTDSVTDHMIGKGCKPENRSGAMMNLIPRARIGCHLWRMLMSPKRSYVPSTTRRCDTYLATLVGTGFRRGADTAWLGIGEYWERGVTAS